MWPDPQTLARTLGLTGPLPLVFAATRTGLAPAALRADDRVRYGGFRSPLRKADWLRGRHALALVLNALGRPYDAAPPVASIQFPNRTVSLSHSGGWAVAVGTASSRVSGIGVDLERGRTPRPQAVRFYLDESERSWLSGQPMRSRPRHRLRLWTAKEAVFKADPANAMVGLADYRLAAPAAAQGVARRVPGIPALSYRYATLNLPGGFVSVAISLKKEVNNDTRDE